MKLLTEVGVLDLDLRNHTYIKVLDYCLKNSKKKLKIKILLIVKKPYQFFFKIFG
jgi:hypothetical protein